MTSVGAISTGGTSCSLETTASNHLKHAKHNHGQKVKIYSDETSYWFDCVDVAIDGEELRPLEVDLVLISAWSVSERADSAPAASKNARTIRSRIG